MPLPPFMTRTRRSTDDHPELLPQTRLGFHVDDGAAANDDTLPVGRGRPGIPLLDVARGERVIDSGVFAVTCGGRKFGSESFVLASKSRAGGWFKPATPSYRAAFAAVQPDDNVAMRALYELDERYYVVRAQSGNLAGNLAENEGRRLAGLHFEEGKTLAQLHVARAQHPVSFTLPKHPGRLVALMPGLLPFALALWRSFLDEDGPSELEWSHYRADMDGFSTHYSLFRGGIDARIETITADGDYLELDRHRFEEYTVKSGRRHAAPCREWWFWDTPDGALQRVQAAAPSRPELAMAATRAGAAAEIAALDGSEPPVDGIWPRAVDEG